MYKKFVSISNKITLLPYLTVERESIFLGLYFVTCIRKQISANTLSKPITANTLRVFYRTWHGLYVFRVFFCPFSRVWHPMGCFPRLAPVVHYIATDTRRTLCFEFCRLIVLNKIDVIRPDAILFQISDSH